MIVTGKFANTLSLDSLTRAVAQLEKGEMTALASTLYGVFEWGLAPEGYDFWKNVWVAVKTGRRMDLSVYPRLKVYRDLALRGKAAA